MASAFGRKFLGYALWGQRAKKSNVRWPPKPLQNFKARIRQLTRRSGGRSMEEVVDKLPPYLHGWKAYFGLAQTPGVWRELDEWLRHRLRAIQLRHWKRSRTIYRELKALGACDDVANQVAGQLPPLVAQQQWSHQARADDCVLRLAGSAQAVLTSNSRTARCGPACRVGGRGLLSRRPLCRCLSDLRLFGPFIGCIAAPLWDGGATLAGIAASSAVGVQTPSTCPVAGSWRIRPPV